MQIQREQLEPTKIKLNLAASQDELDRVKQHVLKDLAKNVKLSGFRPGKAPAGLIEKQVDSAQLQSEFLDHAVNDLYVAAIDQQKIRPVAQPSISVTKFVPFSTLEFTAEVEAVGAIKLADYKKVKISQSENKVTAQEIKDVMTDLQRRVGTKQAATRAAKLGDEVVFDFKGRDAKTNEPIEKGDGQDYPLLLGSKTFIPGFEEELIGLKPGDKKEFNLTFPATYPVKELQKRKVIFAVEVKAVNELVLPKVDNEFAATIGPFKTVEALKNDIKKELAAQKKQQSLQAADNELLEKIAAASQVDIPATLIEEEIDRIEEDERRNIIYRGQTWQEHLDAESVTAEEHRERQRPVAELRIKSGLILGEVAELEGIKVSQDELNARINSLKKQYATDPAMLAELEKTDGRRDIMGRMLTEKTLDKLRSYTTKN